MDLSLVSTNNLIDALMARTEGFAVVFGQTEDGNKPKIFTRWNADVKYVELIGMVDVLKYQLLEEYNRGGGGKDE